MAKILLLFLVLHGQSTTSDSRLTAETEMDNTDATVSVDAESCASSQLSASLSSSKDFVNPRGIRFTTGSSHGLEGWLDSVSTSDNASMQHNDNNCS